MPAPGPGLFPAPTAPEPAEGRCPGRQAPDRELVEQAKRGDQGAFEQLVLDNQNKVYTLALRLVNDRTAAEDLAQEAFVRAWQGLVSFQGGFPVRHRNPPPRSTSVLISFFMKKEKTVPQHRSRLIPAVTR